MYVIKKIAVKMVVFSTVFLTGNLHAEQFITEPTAEWESEKILVLDLMQQEGQRLALLASTPIKEIRPSALNNDVLDNLALNAMYGVGQNVLAEINFNGSTYLYLRGQVWPIGDETGKSQLRLLSMSSRCVLLAHKEQQHNLCVIPTGAQP